MKGSFYRRRCTCKKKRCVCGSKWAFTINLGPDPKTGRRKQKQRSGFKQGKRQKELQTNYFMN